MDRETSLQALNMHKHTVEISLGGKTITLETGYVAKQAAGAVVIRCG